MNSDVDQFSPLRRQRGLFHDTAGEDGSRLVNLLIHVVLPSQEFISLTDRSNGGYRQIRSTTEVDLLCESNVFVSAVQIIVHAVVIDFLTSTIVSYVQIEVPYFFGMTRF